MNAHLTPFTGPVLIELSDVIMQVDASLAEGGSVVPSNGLAEIKVVSVYPSEILPGDYVQRGEYRSLKVTTRRQLGLVWRIAGISTDVGSEVIYLDRGQSVEVVRGFPSGTLPEQDEPRMRLVAAVEQ